MTVHCLAETRQLLLNLRLFQGLFEKDLAVLLQQAELVDCLAGDYVIREGEQGHHLFVLINGKVEVSKRTADAYKTIRKLGPGECFGEMSLIDCRSRSASIIASTNCKVLRIHGEEIDRLPDVAAKLYRNIAIMLSTRLRSANEMLALDSR